MNHTEAATQITLAILNSMGATGADPETMRKVAVATYKEVHQAVVDAERGGGGGSTIPVTRH